MIGRPVPWVRPEASPPFTVCTDPEDLVRIRTRTPAESSPRPQSIRGTLVVSVRPSTYPEGTQTPVLWNKAVRTTGVGPTTWTCPHPSPKPVDRRQGPTPGDVPGPPTECDHGHHTRYGGTKSRNPKFPPTSLTPSLEDRSPTGCPGMDPRVTRPPESW